MLSALCAGHMQLGVVSIVAGCLLFALCAEHGTMVFNMQVMFVGALRRALHATYIHAWYIFTHTNAYVCVLKSVNFGSAITLVQVIDSLAGVHGCHQGSSRHAMGYHQPVEGLVSPSRRRFSRDILSEWKARRHAFPSHSDTDGRRMG